MLVVQVLGSPSNPADRTELIVQDTLLHLKLYSKSILNVIVFLVCFSYFFNAGTRRRSMLRWPKNL